MTAPVPRREFLRQALGASALSLCAPTILAPTAEASLTPEAVAGWVQRFYDQTTTLQTSFFQTYYHRMYRRYQRSAGRLRVSKPGRIRFDYARPNGKVIVSDGRLLTLYQPDEENGAGQHVVRPVGEVALPAAFSFLTGEGDLRADYRTRLLSASAYRFRGQILELRPRTLDPNIRRVLLYVDGHASRRGVVHRLRIDDPEGNRNKFEFRRLRFNRSIADDTFAWRPPRGSRPIGS